jgi:hypothetical protein
MVPFCSGQRFGWCYRCSYNLLWLCKVDEWRVRALLLHLIHLLNRWLVIELFFFCSSSLISFCLCGQPIPRSSLLRFRYLARIQCKNIHRFLRSHWCYPFLWWSFRIKSLWWVEFYQRSPWGWQVVLFCFWSYSLVFFQSWYPSWSTRLGSFQSWTYFLIWSRYFWEGTSKILIWIFWNDG